MSLITKLKNLLRLSDNDCNQLCRQGRECSCQPISFSEAILEVNKIYRRVPDVDMGKELLEIQNRLARLGNQYHERYYGPQNPPQKNPGV